MAQPGAGTTARTAGWRFEAEGLGMGVSGWVGDAENPKDTGGGGKEKGIREGASSLAIREEAIKGEH